MFILPHVALLAKTLDTPCFYWNKFYMLESKENFLSLRQNKDGFQTFCRILERCR